MYVCMIPLVGQDSRRKTQTVPKMSLLDSHLTPESKSPTHKQKCNHSQFEGTHTNRKAVAFILLTESCHLVKVTSRSGRLIRFIDRRSSPQSHRAYLSHILHARLLPRWWIILLLLLLIDEPFLVVEEEEGGDHNSNNNIGFNSGATHCSMPPWTGLRGVSKSLSCSWDPFWFALRQRLLLVWVGHFLPSYCPWWYENIVVRQPPLTKKQHQQQQQQRPVTCG